MIAFDRKFGFGFMRIPENDGVFDIEQIKQMVDVFMENGFTYFDTAHGYCGGKSELVLRECLTERYPRSAYTITDKLSGGHFECREDIRPLFESQLKAVGVDYFDFYLMHAQGRENYDKYKACKAYETALELKAEGKIRHLGISFHDTAEFLDKILTEYPQVEIVQLQFNYLDYDDPGVQSRKCYEVCVKHGKPVIVMEPVKGGKLANVPEEAKAVFDSLGSSPASFAIRYAAGFDNVVMVLSGMSDLAMTKENVSFMKDFRPLDDKEKDGIRKAVEIISKQHSIPCTGCRYCTENCPQSIPVPDIMACLNKKEEHNDKNAGEYYKGAVKGKGKASDCLECGVCESVCPQHLEIRSLLKKASADFE